MSVRQIDRVWRESPYKLARLLVHLAIADFVNDDGIGYCSWVQIMGKTRLSRDTVRLTLADMLADGYLSVTEEPRQHRATVYRMAWPQGAESQASDVSPGGRSTQPEDGSTGPEGRSTPEQRADPPPPEGRSVSVLPSLSSVLSHPSLSSVHSHPSDPLVPVTTEPERLAGLLADLIEGNGSKRPNITRSWLTELERMRRIDDRAWDEIEGAIRWSQADSFWRAHVMSPAKLRQKFDTMRLQAQRGTAGRESTEDVVTRTAQQAAERRAAHGGNMFT